jgi:hypothetical protein
MVISAACSRTEPPRAAGPVAAAAPVAEADARLPVEEPPADAAEVQPVMEGNTGLAVGRKAPAFRLKDQAGTERSLDEFLKGGKVALVFYRSADW